MSFNNIIELINNSFISAFGTLASILSFFITISVFLGIRKIKKFYFFNAMAPQIIDSLVLSAAQLSDQLNAFNGLTTKIYTILADAEINLRSLKGKTNGSFKTRIKNLINLISSLNSNSPIFGLFKKKITPEEQSHLLQTIYVDLYKITAECKNLYDESRWAQ